MTTFKIIIVGTTLLVLALTARPLVAQNSPPMARLVHTGSKYQLLVDGRPFLMLGGQAHNSSASNAADLKPVWDSLVAMHANTAEVPIYWELIEPQPDQFDFHTLDDVIHGAREHGLRLVLLWFGTWKNGAMTYVPGWIKQDPQKYFRVRDAVGQPMDIISPFCAAAQQADEHAFAAVMQHIKSVDASDGTVIMMQVENETGLLGTDRDYSPEASAAYRSPVPSQLTTYLEAHRGHLMPALESAWAANQFRQSGTWQEVFGSLAPEAFSAWYVARYVDAVAAAGKRQYGLPMYCNNWLAGPGAARAGDWPTGGPTVHVLDIWKAAAPHIDLLAPDIYIPEFLETAAEFHRPDNPLFVPETAFVPSYGAYVFPTLAQFNGIGFSPFGIDLGAEGGKLTVTGKALADDYEVLEPLLPLIEQDQYTGRLFSVVQGVDDANAIYLGHELAAVAYYTPEYRFGPPVTPGFGTRRGGGIIIELAPDDYVVAGYGFRLVFQKLQGPPRSPEFLSLEEGTFHGTQWIEKKRLNGDELHVDLLEKPRILRVRFVK
jgi:beta-galactosidase GanA